VTRLYNYATGAGLHTVHWKQESAATWEGFLEWLALDAPSDKKVCGGYVAAELQETTGHKGKPDCVGLHRNKRAVECRSMVTLDADYASLSFAPDVALTLGCAAALYTTWSSTPAAPRWRLIIPLSEDVKPEDYRLLADVLMDELGAEQFDRGSREPERLMHRPSTQGGYYSVVYEGEPLDVRTWLEAARERGFEELAQQREVYTGDDQYADLTYDQQLAADELVQERAEHWRRVWAEAVDWDEDVRDERGRGWEALARDCAWAFAKLAATPWTSLDEDGADLLYHDVVPETVREALPADKWSSGLVAKAADGPVDPPPWGDFDVWREDGSPSLLDGLNDYQPWDIGSDLQLGKRVAREYLAGRYLAWGQTRWALWDGRRWDINVPDDRINGDVREALLHIRKDEIAKADRRRDRAIAAAASNAEKEKAAMVAHADRMKVVARLSKVGILEAAKKLARPDLAVRLEEFDGPATADLLNCGNGVVDLRTGALGPHDPALRFTKLSETPYVPGARHPDWDRCVAALPEDARDWVQRKLGQGSTGHAPTDEIVMFMRGGGENGKTTFLLGVRQALGDFYTTVPDKVINGGPGDHSTEFMPLKGARLAVIEELPGGDWLNGTRLKKAEGSETGMTARPVNQDNVTWTPTHALIATTNHLIQVTDVDHGTRRRLCDLNFPYTFSGVDRDPGLKLRMKLGGGGQHEAALAWLVAGARASYAQPLEREHMPVSVRADTDAWLMVTNPAEEFLSMALLYSPQHSVLTSDVYALYKEWALENGRRVLSDQTFWERARKASIFRMEDVERGYLRSYGEVVTRDGSQRSGQQRVITCVTWSEEMRERVFGFP